MIRRLVVPPLEALRPFLPQVNSADTATRDTVARILQRVATDGDGAVRACTLELDGLDLPPETWEVPRAQWVTALDRLPAALREALELAVVRVTAYHERQRDPGFTFTDAGRQRPGHEGESRWTASASTFPAARPRIPRPSS